jgi:septal ring factor EnvC (AmiA/AmiB activator)
MTQAIRIEGVAVALKPSDGLHADQFIPWIIAGFGSVAAWFAAWFARDKMRDDRQTARDVATERNRIDTAGSYAALTRALMDERTERERAMTAERIERDHERDMFETKIAELRAMVEALQEQRREDLAAARALAEQNVALQEQINYKDRVIEQLRGDNSQLKQMAQSAASVRDRE